MKTLWSPEGVIAMLLVARLAWMGVAKLIRTVDLRLHAGVTVPRYDVEVEAW
jgi:hypothetical protein